MYVPRVDVLAALAVTVAGLVGGPAGPAAAAPGFGQHVASCAQTIGFSAAHNPSHHRGPSGWDATMAC